MQLRLALAVAVLALAAGACRARYSLDRSDEIGSTRDTTIDHVPVRGSLVTVVQSDGTRTRGELLAVDERSVWVLPPREDAVEVPRANVRAVGVAGHTTASAENVDVLFQFARFPQGIPGGAPVAEPSRVASVSPTSAPVPPPPGAPAAPGLADEDEPLGEVPPPPGADAAPPPPGADAPTPPPGADAAPPPEVEVPPPPSQGPHPQAPAAVPGGETGAGLSPPPRGS